MISFISSTPVRDRSGYAPVIGTAASMLGMLIIVAGSAMYMMS